MLFQISGKRMVDKQLVIQEKLEADPQNVLLMDSRIQHKKQKYESIKNIKENVFMTLHGTKDTKHKV